MTEFYKGINLLDKYYQLLSENSKQPYGWNSHIVHMCVLLSQFRGVNTAFFFRSSIMWNANTGQFSLNDSKF